MKNRNRFCPPILSLACLLLALLLSFQQNRLREEALAGRIAPAVLRFHILANSDSRADQQIKLEVRSLILDWASSLLPESSGKEETAALFLEKKEQLEALAGDYLSRRGAGYGARLSLVRDYFPSRSYGPFRFPRGWYDAVRVTLGEGRGHNWWCILYPCFCFVDPVCQVDSQPDPSAKEDSQPPLGTDENSQSGQDVKKTGQPDPGAKKDRQPRPGADENSQSGQDVKKTGQPDPGADENSQSGQDVKKTGRPDPSAKKDRRSRPDVEETDQQWQDTKEIEQLRQDIKEDDYLALEDNRPVLDLRLKCLPGFSFIRPFPGH